MPRSKTTKTLQQVPGRRLRSQETPESEREAKESSSSSTSGSEVEKSSPSPPPPPAREPIRRNKNGKKIGPSRLEQSRQVGVAEARQGSVMNQAELVKNGVQYVVLIGQQKKIPMKKAELLKAMNVNGQSKEFKLALMEVAETLDDVFGLELVGIKQLVDNTWGKCRLDAASSFVVISKFFPVILDPGDSSMPQKDFGKEAAVRIILHSLYILSREIDEDFIWRVLVNAKVDKVCGQRQDLRKFLKTELVDPMYAVRTEVKSSEEITCRYSWGVRAELECDKYALLKHIAETMKKPMASFKKHYAELLNDKKYEERMAMMHHSDNSNQNRNNEQRQPSENSVEEEEDLPEIIPDDENNDEEEEEPVNPRNAKKTK